MKRLAVMLLVLALLPAAAGGEALDLYCAVQKVDDGETPVIIYLEGSAWRADKTIMGNGLYEGTNILCICSQNNQYNFSAIWRKNDMLGLGENIVYRLWQEFPEAAEVVIIGFSNGGYAMDAAYQKCREYGIKTSCAVCMDAYPKRYGLDELEKDGVPVMFAISGTTIRDHVTGRTKEHVKGAEALVKQYDMTHGALEQDAEVQRDVWEFIQEAQHGD